jgi:glycosyltransferase involved in cell wall biosynthesis
VLDDAALLPDPSDVDAIADALKSVLVDETLRDRLVSRGHERVERYTWERAGSELADLYRRVASSPALGA